MSKVLILVSSVRKVRAADGILNSLTARLDEKNINFEIADLRELQLPFVDTELPPMSEDFKIPYDNVQKWSDQVKAADAVIMLTPEHNAGISAPQKNAIDWLAHEWKEKKVGVIGYSWGGAPIARKHLTDVLAKLGSVELSPAASFSFMKDINLDGTAIDQTAVNAAIDSVISEL